MIRFNELRICPDSSSLIIDVSVKNFDIYNDVYIDSIIIDTQDTYNISGPSNNPVYKHTVSEDNLKNVRLELDKKDLINLADNNLFFVYVVAKGTPSASTPCGMDNQITMGVVANLYIFYKSILCSMKELDNKCEIPKHFIDSLLRFKALELSIKTGHYVQAIKYWNKFFKNISNSTVNTRCKCYG